MLHDTANDHGYVALKWAAETEKDGDIEKGCQKPVLQQKTTDDDCSCIE